MSFLGISRGGAYNLLNRPDFPAIRIGKKVLVIKTDFLDYLARNKNNKI